MPLSFASIRQQRYYNISPLLVKTVCLLLTYIKSVYRRAYGKGKKSLHLLNNRQFSLVCASKYQATGSATIPQYSRRFNRFTKGIKLSRVNVLKETIWLTANHNYDFSPT